MPYQLDDLLYLMERLRNPDTGCPWDLKQDFASILPHTLEEAYEVADAIERKDWPHLEEELGDLLFQVVFYGQLANEKALFDFHSIIDLLVAKLIRRHPHVFPEGTLDSERKPDTAPVLEEINQRWDQIKQQEKQSQNTNKQSDSRLLDDVPVTLPAMARANKLQKKASSVNFDWPDTDGVLAKIKEELSEVEEAMRSGNSKDLESEIGDLIFAVINLARHKKINPEVALRGTNQRFYERFAHVEDMAHHLGGWSELSPEDMNSAWEEAKENLADMETLANRS